VKQQTLHLCSDSRFTTHGESVRIESGSLLFCIEPLDLSDTNTGVVALDGGKLLVSGPAALRPIAADRYELTYDQRTCTLIIRDAPWNAPLALQGCKGPAVLLSRRYLRGQTYHDGPIGIWNSRGDCLAFLGAAQGGHIAIFAEHVWQFAQDTTPLRVPIDESAPSLAYRCVCRALQLAFPGQRCFSTGEDPTDSDALAILMCQAALGRVTVYSAKRLPPELRRVCENAGVPWEQRETMSVPRLPVHLVEEASVALVDYFNQFGSVIPEKLAERLKR
jgi:hypothetical protein